MEEQTWFEKKRADMLADIPHKTLHSQIFVNFDYDDLIKIDEILEGFNTEKSKHLDKYHGIELPGIEIELAAAVTAEAIMMFDKLTLKKIIKNSSKKEIILPDSAVGLFHRFDAFDKSILFYFAKAKPVINEDTVSNCFIIASPLIISVLQTNSRGYFEPANEQAFKGPNNTMAVGELNGMTVYSYLFNVSDETKLVIGYNDPYNPEDYHSQLINVKNLMP